MFSVDNGGSDPLGHSGARLWGPCHLLHGTSKIVPFEAPSKGGHSEGALREGVLWARPGSAISHQLINHGQDTATANCTEVGDVKQLWVPQMKGRAGLGGGLALCSQWGAYSDWGTW